jgi:Uma2 family endonuclease
MPSVAAKKYTYEDYAQLPEGSPYQLIDGELVMTPAPTPIHQELSGRLYRDLSRVVEATNAGKVYYAPVDVYFSDVDVFQPDIFFIARGRLGIVTETRVEGPPDLVVEILSPSTGYYDLAHKKNVYESSGVKEYWIADAAEKTLEVLTNLQTGFATHAKAKTQGTVASHLLPDFQVDLSRLFADL